MADTSLDVDKLVADIDRQANVMPVESVSTTKQSSSSSRTGSSVAPLFSETESRAMATELQEAGNEARLKLKAHQQEVETILKGSEKGRKAIAEYNSESEAHKAREAMKIQNTIRDIVNVDLNVPGLLSELNQQHKEETQELIDLQHKMDAAQDKADNGGFWAGMAGDLEVMALEPQLKRKRQNIEAIEGRIQGVNTNLSSTKQALSHTQQLITEELIDRMEQASMDKYAVEAADRRTKLAETNMKATVDSFNMSLEEMTALTRLQAERRLQAVTDLELYRQNKDNLENDHIAKLASISRKVLGKAPVTPDEVAAALKIGGGTLEQLQREAEQGYLLTLEGDNPPIGGDFYSGVRLKQDLRAEDLNQDTNYTKLISRAVADASQRSSEAASPFRLSEAPEEIQNNWINESAQKLAKNDAKDISNTNDNMYKAQPMAILKNYKLVQGTRLYQEDLVNLPEDEPIDENKIVNLALSKTDNDSTYTLQQAANDVRTIFTAAITANNSMFNYSANHLPPQESYNYSLDLRKGLDRMNPLISKTKVDISNYNELLKFMARLKSAQLKTAVQLTAGSPKSQERHKERLEAVNKLREFYTKD